MLFALMMKNLAAAVQGDVERHTDFETAKDDNDVFGLMTIIEEVFTLPNPFASECSKQINAMRALATVTMTHLDCTLQEYGETVARMNEATISLKIAGADNKALAHLFHNKRNLSSSVSQELLDAALIDHVKLAQMLTDFDRRGDYRDILAARDEDGLTMFDMVLYTNGSIEIVREVINTCRAFGVTSLFDNQSKFGLPPLHIACLRSSSVDVLKFVYELNPSALSATAAIVQESETYNFTPLEIARHFNKKDFIEFLEEKQAGGKPVIRGKIIGIGIGIGVRPCSIVADFQ
jgi:hypothetical protein